MQKNSVSVAALCVLLGACASRGPVIESPEVHLSGVELQSLSFDRQSFRLHFDVSNPNPYPLPVKSVRYSVLLDQQQFAGGETAGGFTLPAHGEAAFSISVELDLMKSATRLVTIIGSGASRPIDYELHGSLAVDVPFARPLTFARRGTIMVQP